ncbi:MAG: murein biosynthesis integral membrane protein MurJ [Arenimonas sp.]
MSRPGLLRSLASFTGGTFVSRLLGLLREVVVNTTFGASAATDAFWVAFRIPNFLRRLFAEGSFSTAFVPVLTEAKENGSHEELKLMIARVSGTLGAILLIVTAIGVFFAPQVTSLFAMGAYDEPAKFQLTSDLLRITFPFLLFISLTAMAGGVLNTFHRFAIPAITPVIMNVCMILAALYWAPHFQVPITALAWAILISGLLQLLVQLPSLIKLKLLAWPRWGWSSPEVQKTMKLMLPTLFGSSIMQVNLLLDTLIASFLITGSQTWLSQSDRLLEFPLGMFGVALGTVILPSLSRHHVATDTLGFNKALDWGLRISLLLAVPAMLGLLLLSKPLLITLYQHGNFTSFDSQMAALSLSTLSLGLPAYVLVKVVLPAFYSRQDTTTPLKAGLVAMVMNMVFNVLLVALLFFLWHKPEHMQEGWFAALSKIPGLHAALGLASAMSSYLNLWLLWRAFKRTGIYQPQSGWGRHWLRLGLSCTAMVAILLAGLLYIDDWSAFSLWERIGALSGLIAAGGAAYCVVLFATGFRLSDLRAE